MIRSTENRNWLLPALAVVAIAFILSISPVFAFSNLGAGCNYTRQCSEGYCVNSTCSIPAVLDNFNVTGKCNVTMDCGQGFCESGSCINPTVQDYSVFTPLAGVASGCAGFIDNCGGAWCLFCDGAWILLFIGAVAAAFVSRKRGRITPMLFFALPVLTAILFFPVMGFILAVFEMLIIAFLKKPIKPGLEGIEPSTEVIKQIEPAPKAPEPPVSETPSPPAEPPSAPLPEPKEPELPLTPPPPR